MKHDHALQLGQVKGNMPAVKHGAVCLEMQSF